MGTCEYCGNDDEVCTCYDTASDLRAYLDSAYSESEKLRSRIEALEWLVEVMDMGLWIYFDGHLCMRDCAVFENTRICIAARAAAGV